jgi:hypothetical protein
MLAEHLSELVAGESFGKNAVVGDQEGDACGVVEVGE